MGKQQQETLLKRLHHCPDNAAVSNKTKALTFRPLILVALLLF